MNIWLNVFFFIILYPIFFLIYYVVKQSNGKNGAYTLGVSVQQEWLSDMEVANIMAEHKKQTKLLMIILGLIPIATFFVPGFSIGITIWLLWIMLFVVLSMLPYISGNKKMRQWKQNNGFDTAEDEKWIGGILYYNKEDPRSMVDVRFGLGTTTNCAKPVGKIFVVIAVAAYIFVPILCGWMIMEEYTPIQLFIEKSTEQSANVEQEANTEEILVAKHLKREYEIPVTQMENVELLEELPTWSRTSGSELDCLTKGTFYIRNVGKCEVLLNPQNTAFIYFEAEGMSYYMSDCDDEGTKELYEQIQQMQGE